MFSGDSIKSGYCFLHMNMQDCPTSKSIRFRQESQRQEIISSRGQEKNIHRHREQETHKYGFLLKKIDDKGTQGGVPVTERKEETEWMQLLSIG